MAEIQNQNKQALVKLNSFEILKVITQLIFSVSVFSILLAPSSWLAFPHFFSRISHAVDKNYVFLLCNGLLVFLAKYSGLIRSLSKANRNYEILKAYENISMSHPLLAESDAPLAEGEVSVLGNGSASEITVEPGKKYIRQNWVDDEAVEKETLNSVKDEEVSKIREISEKGDKEKAELKVEENAIFGEEGEGEEEWKKMLSAEELNRKFDDFIRRMKEEIRTQAQPQSVSISSN